MPIIVEIAAGELIDKITILEIKLEQIGEPAESAPISAANMTIADRHAAQGDRAERSAFPTDRRAQRHQCGTVADRGRNPGAANGRRLSGRNSSPLPARSIEATTSRAALKREINMLLQSAIVEEKSYAAY